MGMFDYVKFECICPVCHSKVDSFQTKDTDCNLDTVSPMDADRFYSSCKKCGCWIEFVGEKLPPPIERNYTRYVYGKPDKELEEHRKTLRLKA